MLKIVAGIKGSEENKKLKELITMLNESGITAVYSNDIAVPLWEKYIMMCGNSCAFSYFDSPAGEIQPFPAYTANLRIWQEKAAPKLTKT